MEKILEKCTVHILSCWLKSKLILTCFEYENLIWCEGKKPFLWRVQTIVFTWQVYITNDSIWMPMKILLFYTEIGGDSTSSATWIRSQVKESNTGINPHLMSNIIDITGVSYSIKINAKWHLVGQNDNTNVSHNATIHHYNWIKNIVLFIFEKLQQSNNWHYQIMRGCVYSHTEKILHEWNQQNVCIMSPPFHRYCISEGCFIFDFTSLHFQINDYRKLNE